MRAFALILPVTLALTSSAQAAETITYVYDARGRVVQVIRTGTVDKRGDDHLRHRQGRQPHQQDHHRLPQPSATLGALAQFWIFGGGKS